MKKYILIFLIIAMSALVLCSCNEEKKADRKIEEHSASVENENKPAVESKSEDEETQSEIPLESNPEDEFTVAPRPQMDADVEPILENMSLYEKICQMFIVTPESITGYSEVTRAGDVMKEAIEKYPVGGIIYFSQNIESSFQLKKMIKNSQSYSALPLFIATDQEGGRVARLKGNVGCTVFRSMYSYRSDGAETAYENARIIGSEMKELGFNLDFAPVADIWSNSANTVIGDRAYSNDFAEGAGLVAEAVKGFHASGMMCTLKHFPGHGDTFADSHSGSAYVTKTKAQLDSEEMLPFRAGIEAGADMVMMGHLMVPDIDESSPASISYRIITDYLRGELGFDGVVITDSLEMGAVANMYSSGSSAVKAVQAGVDILLMPSDISSAINAIEKAVESGEITEERINESVVRILKLKQKYNMI